MDILQGFIDWVLIAPTVELTAAFLVVLLLASIFTLLFILLIQLADITGLAIVNLTESMIRRARQ